MLKQSCYILLKCLCHENYKLLIKSYKVKTDDLGFLMLLE